MADFSAHYRSGLGAGATQLVAQYEFSNRSRLRFSEGISRPGLCQFEVYGLDAGAAAPAPGDYLEVRYGGSEVWSGLIYEAIEDQTDKGVWKITGADPLAILDRRGIDSTTEYTTSNEEAVVKSILGLGGAGAADVPIRYSASSIMAGGSTYVFRVSYESVLAALRRFLLVTGKEVWTEREQIGGVWHWVVYYASQRAGGAASGETWDAGDEIEELERVKDDWEKAATVRVVGEGSGESGDGLITGGGGGAATDPRAALPLKSFDDDTTAAQAATTLQSAFSGTRELFIGTCGIAHPPTDTAAQIGETVALRDADAAALGSFRIIFLEVDEEAVDGWYSRMTFIPGSIPALPQVAGPAGTRQPGLTDVEDVAGEHGAFRQRTDLMPTALEAGTPSITAAAGGPVALGAGAFGVTIATQAAGIPVDFGAAEALWAEFSVGLSAGNIALADSHTHGLGNHSHAMAGHVHQENDAGGFTGGPDPSDTTGPIPNLSDGPSTQNVVIQGPFNLQLRLYDALGNYTRIAHWVLPHLPVSGVDFVVGTAGYPFAYRGSDGSWTPTSLRLIMDNLGPYNVTVATGSQATVYKKELHRHNAN